MDYDKDFSFPFQNAENGGVTLNSALWDFSAHLAIRIHCTEANRIHCTDGCNVAIKEPISQRYTCIKSICRYILFLQTTSLSVTFTKYFT